MGYSQLTSSLTHLIPGALVLLYGLATWKRGSYLSKYSLVSALLLLMSGGFHMSQFFQNELYRQVFGRLDHIFIWVVFATGAYGINLFFLEKERRKIYNRILLTLVTLGIWLKAFLFNETRGWTGFTLYFITFAVGSYSLIEIIQHHGWKRLLPFLASILIVGTGGLCERLRSPILIEGYFEYHELFHISVLIGLGIIWSSFKKLEYET